MYVGERRSILVAEEMMIGKITLLTIMLCLISISCLQASSPWLGRDKAMHFLTSAYLTYWNHGLYNDIFEGSDDISLVFAVSLTSFAGTGKEISDRYVKKTKFSWHDMAYNAAGIVFGVLLIKNLK